jgi:hypothetical protein
MTIIFDTAQTLWYFQTKVEEETKTRGSEQNNCHGSKCIPNFIFIFIVTHQLQKNLDSFTVCFRLGYYRQCQLTLFGNFHIPS